MIMSKISFYNNVMVFQTLKLRNNVLIEFLSGNFLVFLSTYRQYYNLVIKNKNYLEL
jgi:hypothetical protein